MGTWGRHLQNALNKTDGNGDIDCGKKTWQQSDKEKPCKNARDFDL